MRFTWKGYSFDLPPGFEVQPEFIPGPEPARAIALQQPPAKASAGCLTIRKPSCYAPDSLPVSENPADLNPRAAGVSIALTALPAKYVGPPLRHLQQSVRVLPDYLKDFKVEVCEGCRVAGHNGARVHYSFATNFRLDQFIYAWLVDEQIISATMTIPGCEADEGWAILQPFVDTFRP